MPHEGKGKTGRQLLLTRFPAWAPAEATAVTHFKAKNHTLSHNTTQFELTNTHI